MNTQRRCLSGDQNGIGIIVAHTTSVDADTIHTGLSSTTEGEGDDVWLEADNPDTSIHVLRLWWGGTTAITNEAVFTLPALTSAIPLINGRPLRNSLVIKVSCDTANKVRVHGYINRITL